MITKSKGVFRIGTSGIVVPGNKQSLPDEFKNKSRLNYYSSLFNTLEVNSTFRKLPMISTLQKWSVDVPDEFEFTIKLWKEITHVRSLNIDLNNIDNFFSVINQIGNKKGCLLIQFPASITSDYLNKIEEILERLQKLDVDNNWRKAIEFRSVTWYNEQTSNLLKNCSASMVLHDMPKSKHLEINEDTTFAYYRFHGPKGDYRGSYSEEFLKEQADNIRGILNNGRDVYVYFNNTMGSAFDNAMQLKAMVER